ncbi:MAG: ZmpA/ZmpB/ZmpC family metallo-endopeptidase-related protein, partial [Cyclonatronaceae bacterium]
MRKREEERNASFPSKALTIKPNVNSAMFSDTIIYKSYQQTLPGFLFFLIIPIFLLVNSANAQVSYTSIETPQDLDNIRNDLDGNYMIMNDIDLEGLNWDPVGSANNPFTGELKSINGSRILNLTIDRPDTDNVGLFSYIEGAIIEEISFENVDIRGRNEVAALTAQIKTTSSDVTTTIENVHILSGTVIGDRKAAGLVGRVDQNSSVNNPLSAKINNSSNAADITSTANEAGGIIAGIEMRTDRVIIEETSNTGDVSVTGWTIGGLVGFGANAHIIRSYSTGTITSNAGGGARTGGLAGLLTGSSLIKESYSDGSVVMNSSVSGAGGLAGIVGRGGDGAIDVEVTKSYSVAEISSSAPNVGGLIGRVDAANGSTVEIDEVYAAGSISTDQSSVGGLIGSIENSSTVTLTAAYWDEQTTGQSSSAGGGNPLQTSQMKGAAAVDTMPEFNITGESTDWATFKRKSADDNGMRTISYPFLVASDVDRSSAPGSETVFFAAGEGSAEDPFIIKNWKDLHDISLYMDAHFELDNTLKSARTAYS